MVSYLLLWSRKIRSQLTSPYPEYILSIQGYLSIPRVHIKHTSTY
uniref:Uncharacterized protein n=1 Tax=Setaria italica TaxID=4555 RepID=K4A4H3_SETIT